MLLSAVSVLVVAQSSSEIPEGLMNNPVCITYCEFVFVALVIQHAKRMCQYFSTLFHKRHDFRNKSY